MDGTCKEPKKGRPQPDDAKAWPHMGIYIIAHIAKQKTQEVICRGPESLLLRANR